MALVVCSGGLTLLLERAIKSALTSDEDYTLKLFKNDVTPAEGDTAATYTEADFTGYSAKTLTRAGWGSAAYAGGKATITYGSAQTFTCSGTGNTVYGYTLCRASNGALICAERFSTTRTFTNGDILTLTPSISTDN